MSEVRFPLVLEAELPHPVGINRTYRSGRNGWYKTAPAREWEQAAMVILRAAGFRTLPAGVYAIEIEVVLRTARLDVDAPLKLVIDTVAKALGLDDRWVREVRAVKEAVRRAEQGMGVRVRVVVLHGCATQRN